MNSEIIVELAKHIKATRPHLFRSLSLCKVAISSENHLLGLNNIIFYVPKGMDYVFGKLSNYSGFIKSACRHISGENIDIVVMYDDEISGVNEEALIKQDHVDFVRDVIKLFDKKCKVIYDNVLPKKR
jgi:hypothetical protein